MARILAIDYGGKRTGMAWTDEFQISINPLNTVETGQLEGTIADLVSTDQVSDIVIGLPTHSDGQLTKIGLKVVDLKKKLENKYTEIKIHTIDEAFTSQRARQMMVHLGTKKKQRRVKENVDKMSAVLILKDFIDSQ